MEQECHWYEKEEVRDNLRIFGRAIQGPSPFRVIIEPDKEKCHSGCCSFSARKITVNPTIFAVPPREQYILTKALLVHEAGHRRFTSPPIIPLPPTIREVANVLEDERVERLMWGEFAGVRWLIQRLAAKFYESSCILDEASQLPGQVISYFLQLRWANRIGRPVKGKLCAQNGLLWERVKPLVFEAWQADTSRIVNQNAAKIVEILTNASKAGKGAK